ncbi:MAG: hypothetical protein J6C33_03880 [Lachnospiraceae bacterium]|nr:hypothetical protein [Lachnospiraceae bacterium]
MTIKKNPHATQQQIALEIDRFERKVKRLMKVMQEEGIIERSGGRKSGNGLKNRVCLNKDER